MSICTLNLDCFEVLLSFLHYKHAAKLASCNKVFHEAVENYFKFVLKEFKWPVNTFSNLALVQFGKIYTRELLICPADAQMDIFNNPPNLKKLLSKKLRLRRQAFPGLGIDKIQFGGYMNALLTYSGDLYALNYQHEFDTNLLLHRVEFEPQQPVIDFSCEAKDLVFLAQDGSVYEMCTSLEDHKIVKVPIPEKVRQVHVSFNYGFAITESEKVYAWSVTIPEVENQGNQNQEAAEGSGSSSSDGEERGYSVIAPKNKKDVKIEFEVFEVLGFEGVIKTLTCGNNFVVILNDDEKIYQAFFDPEHKQTFTVKQIPALRNKPVQSVSSGYSFGLIVERTERPPLKEWEPEYLAEYLESLGRQQKLNQKNEPSSSHHKPPLSFLPS
mmetsp:Transcript_64327/g.73848  ORF Transcript_64327/g.73848 Transcript_64327/m.73848 type:complete len:384 (+) Transcript_64327:28-1179(+)